jgi:hypothetical protein
MKYESLEQIALEADVHSGTGMSRRERLKRWAEVLRTAARAPAVRD